MNRKTLSIIVGLAMTAGCLWLAVQNVHWAELREILLRAHLGWLALGALLCLVDMSLRGARWMLLLRSVAKGPWSLFFRMEAIGFAINNVVFMRLGEFARCYLLGRELKTPFATVLASVILERVLDLFALLLLFIVAAAVVPGVIPDSFRHAGILAFLGIVGLLVTLSVAQGQWKKGPWKGWLKRWPKISAILDQLFLGAGSLRSLGSALGVLALSMAIWCFNGTLYFVTARSLGLERFVDYPRALLVLSGGAVGAAIPAAPGAIGTYEAMAMLILERLGMGSTEAFGFAFLTHMIFLVVITGMGMLFLWQLGVSFSGIQAAAKKEGGGE